MFEPLRVLLVEDSDDDAELVLRFVRKCAPQIIHERVQTENEMRSALQRSWNLVISDYNLPTFSGL
ncbi:MAG: response regulator, partial [Bdellovibrionota bacterium]